MIEKEIIFIVDDPVVGLGLLRTAAVNNRTAVVIARYGCGSLRFAAACTKFYEISLENMAHRLLESLCQLKIDTKSCSMVPAGDIATTALINASTCAELKTFPLPSLNASLRLGSKDKFAEICLEVGVSIPTTEAVENKHSLSDFIDGSRIAYPMIVKPVNMSGGIGIKVVKNTAQLQSIIDDKAFNFSPLVVQEYINGEDIGLSLLAKKGFITHAYVQHRSKSGDRFPLMPELVNQVKKIVAKEDYSGPAHVDARLGRDGKLYLIEFNARFWASVHISDYLGVDLLGLGLMRDASPDNKTATTIVSCELNETFSFSQALLGSLGLGALSSQQRGRFYRAIMADPLAYVFTKLPTLRRFVNRSSVLIFNTKGSEIPAARN
jgi:hypothetical protein